MHSGSSIWEGWFFVFWKLLVRLIYLESVILESKSSNNRGFLFIQLKEMKIVQNKDSHRTFLLFSVILNYCSLSFYCSDTFKNGEICDGNSNNSILRRRSEWKVKSRPILCREGLKNVMHILYTVHPPICQPPICQRFFWKWKIDKSGTLGIAHHKVDIFK